MLFLCSYVLTIDKLGVFCLLLQLTLTISLLFDYFPHDIRILFHSKTRFSNLILLIKHHLFIFFNTSSIARQVLLTIYEISKFIEFWWIRILLQNETVTEGESAQQLRIWIHAYQKEIKITYPINSKILFLLSKVCLNKTCVVTYPDDI
jgi:hypothetical protein